MTVSGDFDNQGKLETGGTLSITAANVNNATTGIINSHQTNITASGNVNNDGRIEGDIVNITGQTITNNGTVMKRGQVV